MARVSRFKLRESDRSGFKFFEIELIKDGPFKVAAEEFDAPPPSKKSLGGEGDISGDTRPNSAFTIANATATVADFVNPIIPVGVDGIVHNLTHIVMLLAATDATVNITASPQITAGQQGNVLVLEVTSNRVILENGNGLALAGSQAYVMDSGDILSLIYQTGGTVWQETSRSPN